MYQIINLNGYTMTKRYVLSYEDLQNIIHESITFFSAKARECMEKRIEMKFSDRTRWIDEFLSTCLRELPIEDLLDSLDKEISSFTGRNLDEIKEDLARKAPIYQEEIEKIKNHMNLRKNQ